MAFTFTIRWCECGWVSEALDQKGRDEAGCPWYCGACGQRIYRCVDFNDGEHDAAFALAKKNAERAKGLAS